MGKDLDKFEKVEDSMDAVKVKKNANFIPVDLKNKLNEITANAILLKGEDGMIELNPRNPHHREWFEEDKYKGR